MRSAAVLALLLCAGQVTALPVNSPMNKGDMEVMRCIVEVISDTLAKPSPMPISQECFETLRGDERILSILRHQDLLKELQDLALQEVTDEAPSTDAVEKREDPEEAPMNEATDGAGPQAIPEPRQEPEIEGGSQALGGQGQGQEATNTHLTTSAPSQKHPGLQASGAMEDPSRGLVDREKDPSAEAGQPAEQEEPEEAKAGVTAVPEEEGPHPSLGYKGLRKGQLEALAADGAQKAEAEEAQPPEGKGKQEHLRQEEQEGGPGGLFQGGKGEKQLQEQEEEQISKEWEDAKRWSKLDQMASELTAEKGLRGVDEEDDSDRAMKLSLRSRAYGLRGPRLQLRRGWRPSSREDSLEAGLPVQVRGFPEEKKEEEGSANRRPEDQELESLSAIEAELEKVAHQLQALRRG
ncbi:chromogranin-A isoform X3 [Carlito syrichta]|uniref:Chromogranin-A n=1 Tax=Carlito syrichta TaxID=1868482 RepID=A0A1U7UZH3_CARSF|nr:chromogranin-A isoform X3 [Carlito syrichta]